MKSLICTINYKFCDFSPTCLQTRNCRIYYVVRKFPNLSRATIHLGTHAHPVVDDKCGKSFQEMKNMVANEVCCTPNATISPITLFVSKTFLSHHLFNEDGQGPMEFFNGEKLDQMLLKYTPLCSFSIRNLITSLKHHPNNSSSIDCILKLKALSCYNYIQNSCFPSQHDGQKVYLFKMSIDRVAFGFDLVQRMQPNDDLQNSWTMFNHVST